MGLVRQYDFSVCRLLPLSWPKQLLLKCLGKYYLSSPMHFYTEQLCSPTMVTHLLKPLCSKLCGGSSPLMVWENMVLCKLEPSRASPFLGLLHSLSNMSPGSPLLATLLPMSLHLSQTSVPSHAEIEGFEKVSLYVHVMCCCIIPRGKIRQCLPLFMFLM